MIKPFLHYNSIADARGMIVPTEIYEHGGQLFEWNIDKNLSNIEKHGISFKEAATVFGDDNSTMLEDENHSDGEERFWVIGFSKNMRLLTICHCLRESDSIIRIISARRATKPEMRKYGG